MKKLFFVKNQDWFMADEAIRNHVYTNEEIIFNGKKINVARLRLWRSSTKVTGNSITAFLQKVDSYVVPTVPYKGLIRASLKSSRSSRIVFIEPFLEKATSISESKVDYDLSFASNLVVELSRAYSERSIPFIPDNTFQISKEGQILLNPMGGKSELFKYSRSHFKNILKTMSRTQTQLEEMSHFSVSSGVATKNTFTEREFYSAWLDGIKYSLNNPTGGLPSFFSKFKHLSTLEFTSGSDLLIINDPSHSENGRNDYRLIEMIRDAMIEAFGFEAFTLLEHGILSFSVDTIGKYDVSVLSHKVADLNSLFSSFNIGTLIDTKNTNLLTGRTIGSYTRQLEFWAANLLIGYRQTFSIKVIDKLGTTTTEVRSMLVKPLNSLLSQLYTNYPEISFSKFDCSINSEILKEFLSDYFKNLVAPLFYSNDYIGTVDNIIEGRQILLKLFYDMIFEKVSKIYVSGEFPAANLDEAYAKDVVKDYAMLLFQEYIYKPISTTGTIDRDIIKLVKEALLNGGGAIHLGSTQIFGEDKGTVNPIFDATGGKDGLAIAIDLSKFTPEVLAKILWTLHYDGLQEVQFKNDIKTIENIQGRIKEPIIHIYTTLYNTLKNYFDNYYAGPTERTDFHVSFYRPMLGGINEFTTLTHAFTGEVKKNVIKLDLDPSKETEFKKNLAAVVFYMVKYISSINIKQGYYNSKIHVLYSSVLRILESRYMKQNFNVEQNTLSGGLQNDFNDNAWMNSDDFSNLPSDYLDGAFTLENFFPVWLFSGADKFHEWFADLFNTQAAITGGADSIFPIFDDSSDILLLK